MIRLTSPEFTIKLRLLVFLLWSWCVISTLIYSVFWLVIDILGIVMVPLAILFGKNQLDITGSKTIFSAPKILWLWGNQQDGYDPEWHVDNTYKGWPVFWRRYSWAAWRNKSSNKRFLWGGFPPAPKPDKINYIESLPYSSGRDGLGWWLCWRGIFVNWQWFRKGNKFTEYGPRYDPSDAKWVPTTDWRRYGAGWAARTFGKW